MADRGIPFRPQAQPPVNPLAGMLMQSFSPMSPFIEHASVAGRQVPTFPKDSNKDYTERDLDVVSRTAYGEARGEGDEGIRAVLHVMRNRKLLGDDTSYSEVALKPRQFSAWNQGDPNRELIQSLGEEELADTRDIAEEVLSGESEDPTGGATHYHAKEVSPKWASEMRPTATIGRHRFYRED